MEKKSTAKAIFGITGTIFFFASYFPYIRIIFSSAEGVQEGLFGGQIIYGFDAMIHLLQWFCIIPVIPVCFIYQVVFGITYIRKRKVLSVITISLASLIIAGVLTAGLPAEIKKIHQIKKDEPVITEFLDEKYGHGMASDLRMSVFDYKSHGYKIESHVLPDGLFFYAYADSTGSGDIYDDLIETFTRVNNEYSDRFNAYVNSKYDHPENVRFRATIESIDFGDYKYGDDFTVLFDRTDYMINTIEFDTDDLNDDIVNGIIKDVWNNYFSQTEIPEGTDHLILYIKQNGKYAFSAAIFPGKGDTPASALITTYADYPVVTKLNGSRILLDQ